MATTTYEFESTLAAEWDTVTDNEAVLDLNGSAAMTGSQGMEVSAAVTDGGLLIDDPGVDPDISGVIRIGFQFDKHTYDASAAFGSGFELQLQSLVGDPVFSVFTDLDGSTEIFSVLLYGASQQEIDMDASQMNFEARIQRSSGEMASDGTVELWVNSISVLSLTGIDNYDDFVARSAQLFFESSIEFTGTFYLDHIVISDEDSPIFPEDVNSFRALGVAADTRHLYVTGLKDGATLQLYRYDIETLAEAGTPTFGSATDSDLDDGTRGVKPIWSYGRDGIVYLYGRDGNNIQVQRNTTSGTGTWSDVGPGTAIWPTDKVAVALMPWVLDPDDLIVCFADDDIYRSFDNTETWAKQGDAPMGLYSTKRHAVFGDRLIMGGTAAGSVIYSQNGGVSSELRGGSPVNGKVNAAAISY